MLPFFCSSSIASTQSFVDESSHDYNTWLEKISVLERHRAWTTSVLIEPAEQACARVPATVSCQAGQGILG